MLDQSVYFFCRSVFLYSSSSSFCTFGKTGRWVWNETVSEMSHVSEAQEAYLVPHAELALALCRTAKLRRVAEHIVEGHLRYRRELVLADLRVNDGTTARVQSTNDST